MKTYTLCWKKYALTLGPKTAIMGIVNVTPDSFSDGGHYQSVEAAVAQAKQLVASGADIIDIGGESTRPFADAVPAHEEISRVLPVIKQLSTQIPVPLSIDTTKAEVADAAIGAGAAMINDIAAFRLDSQMPQVAAHYGVPVILMHMKGTPRTMQVNPTYSNVVIEVRQFLADAINQAVLTGIARSNVIIDPGIGFGKTTQHNLLLIQQLAQFAELDVPILVGPSRKRFIRDLVKSPNETSDIQPNRPDVEIGTQAAVAASILNGAHIVRVHDVANTQAMVKVINAIQMA